VVHVTQVVKAGVRRHLVDLITGLHELGVRQAFVYSLFGPDPAAPDAIAAIAALGVTTVEIPMVREISPVQDARDAARLWAALRRLRPSVLHLHSSKAGGLGRLVAPFLPAEVAVVYTPHGNAANFSPRYATVERLLGRLRTDRLVAVSGSEYDELAGLGYVPRERLARVDSGLPLEQIRRWAAGPPPALPAGRRLVVAAARLSSPKDPCFLVRVSRRVAERHPDVHFVWAGDGELRPDVEREIAASGVADRWTLLGWLVDPYPLLAAATVVVLPSGFESFGYTTLEAMVLGKPVVATDVTGSRDLVIPGVTGELTPVGDEGAFAAALDRVLADPARAERYGRAAAARAVAHYTHERMAAETLAVYRAALVGRAPRSPVLRPDPAPPARS
jgi:glycosyltransferase involved in cell wall biosynthesis